MSLKGKRLYLILVFYPPSFLLRPPIRIYRNVEKNYNKRTTMNSQSCDRRRWKDLGVDAELAHNANSVGDAYLDLGCEMSFTCAPYLLPTRPKLGDDIAWGESNAVVYANSVSHYTYVHVRVRYYIDRGRCDLSSFHVADEFGNSLRFCRGRSCDCCCSCCSGSMRLRS